MMEYQSIEEMIEESIQRGIDKARIESIRALMETLKLTAQQAMDLLKIPADEQPKYLAKI